MIEAVEKKSNKIHEAADVFYHLTMYLEAHNIKVEEVMNELDKEINFRILPLFENISFYLLFVPA